MLKWVLFISNLGNVFELKAVHLVARIKPATAVVLFFRQEFKPHSCQALTVYEARPYPRAKQLKCDVNHSPPFTAEVVTI